MTGKIAITGSTGLVGTALCEWLLDNGWEVSRLVRPATDARYRDGSILWDYKAKKIDPAKLEGFDAVVHLAGVNIAGGRWTSRYKEAVLRSRADSTRFLSEVLAGRDKPPKVFISTSAVGFYGNRPAEESVTETSVSGSGFLADVCRQWEEATRPAEIAGIRVVQMRLGTVLSRKGGALGKMLPVFQLGLGGIIGTGQQMMSWIAAEEIPGIVQYVIRTETIRGPVNAVAPHPVSNREFTRALGKALKRPVFLPLPAFAVKLMFGEMGEELLLGGARVVPSVLTKTGYRFRYPDIDAALAASLR